MRTSDADILVVPGLGGSGPDHWQTRWQGKLSTARRIEQADWNRPELDGWTAALVEAVEASRRPTVVVAHSLGVPTLAHAAPRFPANAVRGAFLVAMPDLERPDVPPEIEGFAPLPRDPLPFPSLLVASRNTPIAPMGAPRIFPIPGARPSSTRARPATSTRRAATGLGRRV